MRLFIAINVDSALRAPLAAVQATLKSTATPVSWVKPENLHFTLKFLGEVPESRLPALQETFRSSVAGIGRFILSLAGLGTFPPRGRPRVVWVGVEHGVDEMRTLQGRIDETLLPLGFARETRPLHPHLTLGRVRYVGRLDALLTVLRVTEIGRVGQMHVRCVDLMRSALHPAGAVYTRVESVPLSEEN
ncbi:MAG: RNA 2',3'-cyclic phosphodiesterase [candidate division NC10 bacterium]|nr:RNA 2',3'-cyclic phosphodiesterase [candidate division NC10 bacterium]